MTGRSGPRAEILKIVNRGRAKSEPYRMRHIQIAVNAGRQRGVLDDRLLVGAGFRPGRAITEAPPAFLARRRASLGSFLRARDRAHRFWGVGARRRAERAAVAE